MGFGKAQKIARNKSKANSIKQQERKELIDGINKMDDNVIYSISGFSNSPIYNAGHLGKVWKEFLKRGEV